MCRMTSNIIPNSPVEYFADSSKVSNICQHVAETNVKWADKKWGKPRSKIKTSIKNKQQSNQE